MYRKQKGLCPNCGKLPLEGSVYCENCKTKMRELHRQAKKKHKFYSSVKKPKISISDVQKMAEQRGISYGQMVVLMEQEGK